VSAPKDPQAERLGQLLGFFAEQGRHGGYGQKQLAAELGLTPQALRRRSALALRGTAPQAMAVAQLHQLAQISVAQVAQLRGKDWQEVAAWLQGLDRLLPLGMRLAGQICADEGRCHGSLAWCDICGDVKMLCDDPACDLHRERRQEALDEAAYRIGVDTGDLKKIPDAIQEQIRRLHVFRDARGPWDAQGGIAWCYLAPVDAVAIHGKLLEAGADPRVEDPQHRPRHAVPCGACLDDPERYGIHCNPFTRGAA
jgi:hypothetical protein